MNHHSGMVLGVGHRAKTLLANINGPKQRADRVAGRRSLFIIQPSQRTVPQSSFVRASCRVPKGPLREPNIP